jgi:hypothetical protein
VRFRKGILREQVWQGSQGKIVNYNLALINHGGLRITDECSDMTTATAITISMKRMERFLNEMRRLRDKKEPV